MTKLILLPLFRAVVDGMELLMNCDDEVPAPESTVGVTHEKAQRTIEAARAKAQATHSTTWTVRL